MSLKPFTYPFPETRFLHAGPSVYKFKIRYGHSIRGEEIANKEVIIQELEESTSRRIPFSYLSVFLTDSKWGHNLPGAIVPPLQQNNSPPPKELGLRGFFGFLSTLFPLRYFFKKSSQ
uniref:Membrane anchored junction protein n=1 Tax=Chinchilla lanigera TaxID=34839 RepID=A0A8C2W2S8_CHILA